MTDIFFKFCNNICKNIKVFQKNAVIDNVRKNKIPNKKGVTKCTQCGQDVIVSEMK